MYLAAVSGRPWCPLRVALREWSSSDLLLTWLLEPKKRASSFFFLPSPRPNATSRHGPCRMRNWHSSLDASHPPCSGGDGVAPTCAVLPPLRVACSPGPVRT